MSFDIHSLDHAVGEDELEEGKFGKYLDGLLDQFLESPEGKARAAEDPEMGFWAHSFLEHAFTYIGVLPTTMAAGNAEEIIEEIFPRKVSITSPDEADDALPELIALWTFLEREYQLPQAPSILRYLRSVKPADFRHSMMDLSRAGMAKSLFLMGQAAGYDMTNEEEMGKFFAAYNAGLVAGAGGAPGLPALGGGLPPGFGSEALGPVRPGGTQKSKSSRDKRARKIANASRKKNRKRR